MTDAETLGLIWAPFAMVFGLVFLLARRRISRLAREQMRRQGLHVGRYTQTPLMMAIGGVVCIAAGAWVAFLAATGRIASGS